jgi:hypothetical protein
MVSRNEPLFEDMGDETGAWLMKKKRVLPPLFPTNIC